MQKSCACKFLYGPDTTIEKITLIENSLENREELKTEALFRKKDLTPFWCLLDIVPIKNEKGEVVLYLASHKDITKTKMASMDEDKDYDEEDSENNYLNDLPSNYNYNRRRSRAVLYHLSGHLKEQEKKKKRRKLKLNSGLLSPKSTVLPEYKVAAMKKSRAIVLHYSIMKSVWDWCVLLATLYIAIVVPFNAAVHQENELVITILDIIIEIIFIIDVAINFRTTYVSKSGKVVYEARAIGLNYLRSWFFIDLLAAVPFDILTQIFSLKLDTIQLIKLARLLRLLRLLNKIERYSQYSAIVLTFFMLAFALLAHWLACIWFVIGRMELNKNDDGWDLGWIVDLGDQLKMPILGVNSTGPRNDSIYITALYYTLSSLTSVGFGNVSANTNTEKIFTILVMFLGALCHAAVFGNVTAIIQRMYSRRALYYTKLRDLKDFVRSHHIPPALKTRMQEYFMTSWSINMGIDTTEMLQTFPEELRADIAMHLHKEFLALPIFADASQGCLRSLSLRIKTSFCAPGEYIVHQGDALNVIYFLLNGSMEILRHGMVVAILGKGDLFGCDLYITDTVIQSSGDIHALTYCDLQSVTRQELLEVLASYPEYQSKFQQEISRDLTFNLREGYDSEAEEKYSYCETNNSGRNTRLTSISEVRDEDEVGTSKQTRDSSTDTGEDGMENRHMLLDVSNSIATSVPPDLSPRVVDGVEDEGSPFKRHTFDFPAARSNVHSAASRHRSLTLTPRQPLVGESRMRTSYTAPQLSQDHTTRSNSSDSLYQEDLRHELEYTRNSVERLDKQVSNLSRDVSNLSQDLRAVVKLLQVISPMASSSQNQASNVAAAVVSSGLNGPATPGLPAPPAPCVMTVKIGQGGEEDIIHVQRQDGVLETSLGGGIPELPPGTMGPTVAALTSAVMASATSNSACSTLERPRKRTNSSDTAKDEEGASGTSVKETNLVLFQGPDENLTESESLERLDYDSENGTDL
ncbi:potassium voltage-gated channel subfamily H member 8-like [Lytechinus pictus]|uniref:potassium voltage-gated channel subfamily H member 8-like n=1 Tax=Lytechinus pictus TaxID=7653 RepID=UPI0030B9C4B4